MVDPIESKAGEPTDQARNPEQEGSPAMIVIIMVLLLVALVVWYRFK